MSNPNKPYQNHPLAVIFYNPLVITLFILGVIACCSSPFLLLAISDHNRLEARYKFNATRVSSETIADLCLHHLIPTTIADCSAPNITITYADIPAIINANLKDESSFEDVQTLFEDYRIRCESVDYKLYHYQCIYRLDDFLFIVYRHVTKKTYRIEYPQEWEDSS